MDELAAPCPEDSRGSASGLGSERSLIGRPAKPEADKQRSKSWRCTLEAPSEAQQSRLRAAGMDRCTSKLHTADCLVRSLPACPRRRRPVRGARVHRRWRRATAHRMERHQPGRPIRGPRTPARTCAGRSCWSCVRLFQTLAGARAFQNLAERPVRRWGGPSHCGQCGFCSMSLEYM